MAGGQRFNSQIIDETKINQVHWDLRVVGGSERVPNGLLIESRAARTGTYSFLSSDRRAQSERIRVLAGNPEEPARTAHRVASAKILSDVHGSSRGQKHSVSRRNFGGFTIPGQKHGSGVLH